jgi:hypothetical protein
VARNKALKPEQIDATQFVAIPNKGNHEIQTQIIRTEDESILYCKSTKMGLKEKAMQEKFCSRFEAELDKINAGLAAKRAPGRSPSIYCCSGLSYRQCDSASTKRE